MKLAIVGSTHFDKDPFAAYKAREMIRRELRIVRPKLVISGGAPGIDTIAEELAVELGIPTEIFLPENNRWAPRGYKARNILIAETCKRLLCVRHEDSATYGSGWTADYAAAMGKNVDRRTFTHKKPHF
jgi:predicted Rossmann fold nucleotide-binding protein DprA/Smf involved in DNA uptake